MALSFCKYVINHQKFNNNEKSISKIVLHGIVERSVSGIRMVLRTVRV